MHIQHNESTSGHIGNMCDIYLIHSIILFCLVIFKLCIKGMAVKGMQTR